MSAADKLEITELLYRYAELIDAGDFRRRRRPAGPGQLRWPQHPSVSGAQNIAGLFGMTTRRFTDSVLEDPSPRPQRDRRPRRRHRRGAVDVSWSCRPPTPCGSSRSWPAATTTGSPATRTAGTSPNVSPVSRWSATFSDHLLIDPHRVRPVMHYDLRLRPAQPATPAPDAFTIHRAESPAEPRTGRAVAGFHPRGSGRLPAAPPARLSRDQADLVAQHHSHWPTPATM